MYTTGEIAAQICLENPGLDTLDVAVFWGGSPTIASTQTILVNAAMSKAHYLEQNQYQAVGPRSRPLQLAIPGQHELALALPWGGTSHPVWFRKDPRVANVSALGGVFNQPLMLGRAADRGGGARGHQGHGRRREVRCAASHRGPGDEPDAARASTPRLNKSLDSVHASGPLGRAHCVIHGNQQLQADRAPPGLRRLLAAPAGPHGGPASPRRARPSATASCSACCAPSAW